MASPLPKCVLMSLSRLYKLSVNMICVSPLEVWIVIRNLRSGLPDTYENAVVLSANSAEFRLICEIRPES